MNEWSYIIQLSYEQTVIANRKERGDMNNLKAIRTEKGFTQSKIAEKVGITLRCYQRYEAEDGRVPDVLTAIKILDVLRVANPRKVWSGNPLP